MGQRRPSAATLFGWSRRLFPPSPGRPTGEPGPGVAAGRSPEAVPFRHRRLLRRPLGSESRRTLTRSIRCGRASGPPQTWRLARERGCDDRTRIQEPGAARLQPHPGDRRGFRRPRDAPVALPEAGVRRRRQHVQLPARIGRRRRALRPLFVHRPAGANAAALDRPSHRGRERRPRRRDRRGQPARLHRRLPAALSRRAAAGAAALLRRSRRLLQLRRRALHRASPGRIGAGEGAARSDRHARHPARAVRGGRRHRQPLGAPLSHRLRRPGRCPRLVRTRPAAPRRARRQAAPRASPRRRCERVAEPVSSASSTRATSSRRSPAPRSTSPPAT